MQSDWLGLSLSNQVLHLPVVVDNKASNLMVSNLMVSKNALMCRPLKTELELQWPEAIFKTRTTIEFREFSRRLSHTLQIYPGLGRRKTARFSKGVNPPSSLGLEWRYSNVFSELIASLGLAGKFPRRWSGDSRATILRGLPDDVQRPLLSLMTWQMKFATTNRLNRSLFLLIYQALLGF